MPRDLVWKTALILLSVYTLVGLFAFAWLSAGVWLVHRNLIRPLDVDPILFIALAVGYGLIGLIVLTVFVLALSIGRRRFTWWSVSLRLALTFLAVAVMAVTGHYGMLVAIGLGGTAALTLTANILELVVRRLRMNPGAN